MNILWDFDGTIMNTYPVYTKIFQSIVGEHVSIDKILVKLKVSFSHAEEHFELTESQIQQLRDECDRVSVDEVKPFDNVEEVLKRANLNVIMTHKSRKQVIEILSHHGLYHYFADMVAGDDGFPRKPHAGSYQYLHEKFHLDLAIGDREIDIIPAKEIGIKTCLFQNHTEGADFYLQSYDQYGKIFSNGC